MTLKHRFAFLFGFFVFVFLLVAFSSVYILGENFRRDEFNDRLLTLAQRADQAYTKSSSFSLSKSNTSLIAETVAVFDHNANLVFQSPDNKIPTISPKFFKKAKPKKFASFKLNDRDAILIRNSKYFIIAAAYDKYGLRKMWNLKNSLIIISALGLILSCIFAFFFFRKVIKPLNQLNEQLQGISENSLHIELQFDGNYKELDRIRKSINSMLNRINQSFEMQKNFVHHASHELRTPLANMLSQTESALGRELDNSQLRGVLLSLREDQIGLTNLINSLLSLSQFETSNSTDHLVPVRIDEVLYASIEKVMEFYPDALISLDFAIVPENDNDLTVKGNESLIKTAIENLVKNAYIYSSDKRVSIIIKAEDPIVEVIIENTGNQPSKEEIPRLFEPFYRGENALNIKGTGLGLSLVKRIVDIHHGSIRYKGSGKDLNQFILRLVK